MGTPTLEDGTATTPELVADMLGEALDLIKGIESVGSRELDDDLLAAEQALRRVRTKLKQ